MKDLRRVVRRGGAIGLPKEIQNIAGIRPGMSVDVRYDRNSGEIVIKPLGRICPCCNTPVMETFFDSGFCNKCSSAVERMVKQGVGLTKAIARVERGDI